MVTKSIFKIMYKQYYSVGFLFDSDLNRVILIEKTRPLWQRGKLNGVGGKALDGETLLNCQIREFEEETGVRIEDWEEFAALEGEDYYVGVFRARNSIAAWKCKSTTDEEVGCYNTHDLPKNCVSNLYWLIPMAINQQGNKVITILL